MLRSQFLKVMRVIRGHSVNQHSIGQKIIPNLFNRVMLVIPEIINRRMPIMKFEKMKPLNWSNILCRIAVMKIWMVQY